MFHKQDSDHGVSPVVGVILMVAVTVILAAVIGTFVLNLGSQTNQNAQAGVSFDQDASNSSVTVQVVSISQADHLDIRVSDSSVTVYCPVSASGKCLDSVGQTAVVGGSGGGATGLSDGDRITVVGTYEGKETVIQTFTYSP